MRRLALLAAVALVLGSTVGGVAAIGDATPDTVEVGFAQTERQVDPGGTATYEVVVTSADQGVSLFQLSVSLGDPSVATIENVSVVHAATTNSTEVSDQGSTGYVASLGMDEDGPEVVVATVTVVGESAGTTDLELSVEAVGNSSGKPYEVTIGAGTATLTVGDGGSGDTTTTTSTATTTDGGGETTTTDDGGETTTTDDGTTTTATTTTTADDGSGGSDGASGGDGSGGDSSGSTPGFTAGLALVAILALLGVARVRRD